MEIFEGPLVIGLLVAVKAFHGGVWLYRFLNWATTPWPESFEIE